MTRPMTRRGAMLTSVTAASWLTAVGAAWAHGEGEYGEEGSLLPTTVGGLPLHPLVVHLVVVLVPLASLVVLVTALWPAARRRLGWATPALGVLALISVPIAESSGEALLQDVEVSPLTGAHAELAEGLLPWAAGLAVWSVLIWLWELRLGRAPGTGSGWWGRALAVVVVVGAIAVSVGSTAEVVQIGESGARSVWTTASP